MKKSIYYGILAVIALLFAACPEEAVLEGGGSVIPKGNETPGVYVTFNATVGAFQGGGKTLDVPLAFKPVREVAKWYNVDGSEITGDNREAAFLSALDGKEGGEVYSTYGYDYNDDPLGLKKAAENSPNPKTGYPAFLFSEVQKYRYFIQQQKVSGEWVDMFAAPVAKNMLFNGWYINGSPVSPVTVANGEKDPFDTRNWDIDLSEPLASRTKAYMSIVAKWVADPETETSKVELKKKLEDITARLNGYNDDYVVGKPFEGTAEDDAKVNKLQEFLTEAAQLLQGDTDTLEIQGIEDSGNGETESATIEVVTYNTQRMTEVKGKIDDLLKDEAVIAALANTVIYPQEATIPYPADTYKYQSVTIAADGDYEIELWGATGGPIWSTNGKTALGGWGGHVKAKVTLKAGDVLKFFIGGAGAGSALYDPASGRFSKNSANYNLSKAGGLPNGGAGDRAWNNQNNTAAPTYAAGSGGGGSTDVRFFADGYNDTEVGKKQEMGVSAATVYDRTLYARILVAGGGGGAAQGHDVGEPIGWAGIRGGNSGGKNGAITGGGDPANYYTSGADDGKGVNGINLRDDAGKSNWEGRAGGGGGYVGGSAATKGLEVASGGGGTNHTATSIEGRTITNSITEDADYLSSFYGNGKATIKYLPPEVTEDSNE
jgi:hypothetical protein